MNRYEIKCTESQTRKALEFGAPIERIPIGGRDASRPSYFTKSPDEEGYQECPAYYIPTAEEMLGWLEEQGLCIEPYRTACGYLCTISKVPTGSQIYIQEFEGDDKDSGQFTTRGKATLAAIDAALEYLSNKKK